MVDLNDKISEVVISPALPLHDPDIPWLPVVMINGENKKVDLKTLFKESHLIREVTLEISASTAALYRILIAIAYALLEEKIEDCYPSDWDKFKAQIIKTNTNPFDENKIEEYFERWKERFYLIHPTSPFLQDASLYKDIFIEKEDSIRNLQKYVAPISSLHPLKATRAGNKPIWNLPVEDYYTPELPINYRVETLFSNLLFQKYSTTATKRTTRKFEEKIASNSYPVTHGYRCAVHYIPQLETLASTLLISMPYVENLTGDTPEWEWEINRLGYPGLNGIDHAPTERYLSATAPRSSINASQLALLYVPEFVANPEGTIVSKPEGGALKVLRSVAYSYKYPVTESQVLTWNPYCAYKDDGKTIKAYKTVYAVYPLTMLKNSDMVRIPFLPNKEIIKDKNKEKIILPEAVFELRNSATYVYQEIKNKAIPVRTLVFSGDPSQEKTKNYFELKTPPIILEKHVKSPETHKIITDWLNIASKIAWELKTQIGFGIKKPDSEGKPVDVSTEVEIQYWSYITPLFEKNLNSDIIQPITQYKNQIKTETMKIYEDFTFTTRLAAPLRVGEHANTLSRKIYFLLNSTLQGQK